MTRIFLPIIFILLSSFAFAEKSSPEKELSDSEMTQLERGELVLKTKEVEKGPWPEITLYTLVDATPLEAMGIFSALDYQAAYVPNIISSRPVKHISAVEVLTEYEMHVPFPLSNARYTHGSVVHHYDDDYELTWYKVESTSTEDVKGSAYFSAHKKKTLFRYRSYIKPKSIFGSFVKKIMMKDVQASILAIKNHIEKLKKENSPLLAKYSGFIERSLTGEFVYQESLQKK